MRKKDRKKKKLFFTDFCRALRIDIVLFVDMSGERELAHRRTPVLIVPCAYGEGEKERKENT